MRTARTQRTPAPPPCRANGAGNFGGDVGSAPRTAGIAKDLGKVVAVKGSRTLGEQGVNGRSVPLGWGFRSVRRGRNDHAQRHAAIRALIAAGPALLALSPGLIARDAAVCLGVPYRVAYAAARDLRHARARA